jgi:hypothetical protein
MFCDLVGSTALASYLDPEDLREVIAAYHKCAAAEDSDIYTPNEVSYASTGRDFATEVHRNPFGGPATTSTTTPDQWAIIIAG